MKECSECGNHKYVDDGEKTDVSYVFNTCMFVILLCSPSVFLGLGYLLKGLGNHNIVLSVIGLILISLPYHFIKIIYEGFKGDQNDTERIQK